MRSIIWNDETEFFEPANFKELYILQKPLQTKDNRPLDGDTSLEAIAGIENRQLVTPPARAAQPKAEHADRQDTINK